MSKLSSLAVTAALSLGMLSTAAFAMQLDVAGPRGVTSTDNGPIICIAACPPPVVGAASNDKYSACGDKLAQLRPVTIRQIQHVAPPEVVHLVPVCDHLNHTLTETESRYLSLGNVGGLVSAIGRNPLLASELKVHGYDPDAVVGVVLAPNAAVLYVSHR